MDQAAESKIFVSTCKINKMNFLKQFKDTKTILVRGQDEERHTLAGGIQFANSCLRADQWHPVELSVMIGMFTSAPTGQSS